jgi:hypothetical protein
MEDSTDTSVTVVTWIHEFRGALTSLFIPVDPDQVYIAMTFYGEGGGMDFSLRPGDVNHDFKIEVSDYLFFSRYFLEGLKIFTDQGIDSAWYSRATDVNGDSEPLSVSDLVYLIRQVLGDLPPLHRISVPREESLSWTMQDDRIVIESPPLDGLWIQLEGLRKKPSATDGRLQQVRPGTWNMLIVHFDGTAINGSSKPIEILLGANNRPREISMQASSVDGQVVNIAEKEAPLPDAYELLANSPNPFNPSTQITFSLPAASDISLDIYNVLGGHVVTLSRGWMEAGKHTVTWNAGHAGSGTYFYRLAAGGYTQTRKMLLLK